eukprot:m.234799 g.234799  ORF g.234799 m.234799 type:complete len:202 (-) comp19764_c0_seq1:261-866(-)
MSWSLQAVVQGEGMVIHVLEGEHHKEVLSVAQVILLLQTSVFAAWFTQQLLHLVPTPTGAVFFECRPVNSAHLTTQLFEAMVLPAPQLERVASERDAFAAHWSKASSGVVTFTNLGRDAVLVAPAPSSPASQYPHLTSFLRTGSPETVAEFWRQVAVAFEQRVHERKHKPTWLSTSGLGVSWLHMRIDDRPKYYRWAPYTH